MRRIVERLFNVTPAQFQPRVDRTSFEARRDRERRRAPGALGFAALMGLFIGYSLPLHAALIASLALAWSALAYTYLTGCFQSFESYARSGPVSALSMVLFGASFALLLYGSCADEGISSNERLLLMGGIPLIGLIVYTGVRGALSLQAAYAREWQRRLDA